jgi:hypothetical protein
MNDVQQSRNFSCCFALQFVCAVLTQILMMLSSYLCCCRKKIKKNAKSIEFHVGRRVKKRLLNWIKYMEKENKSMVNLLLNDDQTMPPTLNMKEEWAQPILWWAPFGLQMIAVEVARCNDHVYTLSKIVLCIYIFRIAFVPQNTSPTLLTTYQFVCDRLTKLRFGVPHHMMNNIKKNKKKTTRLSSLQTPTMRFFILILSLCALWSFGFHRFRTSFEYVFRCAQNCNKLTMSACIYALIIKTIPYNLFTFEELCFFFFSNNTQWCWDVQCVWFLNSFIALSSTWIIFFFFSSLSKSRKTWKNFISLLLFNRHFRHFFYLFWAQLEWGEVMILHRIMNQIHHNLSPFDDRKERKESDEFKRDERSALLIKKWFFFIPHRA